MVDCLIQVFRDGGVWAVNAGTGPHAVFNSCAQAVSHASRLADVDGETTATVRVYFNPRPQDAA